MPFSLFSSAGESNQFPPKPLRESQNRLLNNGQSEGSEDRDKRGDGPHLRSIQNTASLSVRCALTIRDTFTALNVYYKQHGAQSVFI